MDEITDIKFVEEDNIFLVKYHNDPEPEIQFVQDPEKIVTYTGTKQVKSKK